MFKLKKDFCHSCFKQESRPQGYAQLTQLSKKFQLIIKTKIQTNKEVSCLNLLKWCIYHVDKSWSKLKCQQLLADLDQHSTLQ